MVEQNPETSMSWSETPSATPEARKPIEELSSLDVNITDLCETKLQNQLLPADPDLYGPGFIPPHKIRKLQKQSEQGHDTQMIPQIHPETARIATIWQTHPRLDTYIRHRMGRGSSTSDHQDVKAEVLLALVKRWADKPPEQMDEENSDERWGLMYGIAANKIADHFRHEGRKRYDLIEDVPDTAITAGAEEGFWENWNRARAKAVLLTVAPPQRMRRVMLMLEGLSAEEKAEILGITPVSVRVGEHRIRKRLREAIDKQFPGQDIGFGFQGMPPSERPPVREVPPSDIKKKVQERQTKKEQSSKQDQPKLTPDQLRTIAVDDLHAISVGEQTRGNRELSVFISTYLGAWSIALPVLDRLRANETEAKVALVFPHEHLLPQFRDFMEKYIGGLTGSYLIETPATLANTLAQHPLEYVAVPSGSVRGSLNVKLRTQASFMLNLLIRRPKRSNENGCYSTPSYRNVNGKHQAWSKEDSIRYLQEYQLKSGDELTWSRARSIGVSGEGPSIYRLEKDTTFDALSIAAGYPPNS